MKRRVIATMGACLIATAGVVVFQAPPPRAHAGTVGPDCCFSITCGGQQSTTCIGRACIPPDVCRGKGGCTPTPWSSAWCGPAPGGVS